MVGAVDDSAWMDRALFWAERGRGRTSPNPFVGAVVVTSDGIVVGQGSTRPAGGPHAEVVALEAAGARARGGTLYVTLEPCSHTGRTAPCVERVVAAGVRRVVMAVRDPNPLVSGRGEAFLRRHGVDVTTDVRRAEATAQHVAFFKWVTRRRPLVIAKAAVSADGFVGTEAGPIRLTGPAADRYFHRQRAEIDAIAVGSGTVMTDDPRLTPRGVWRHRPLVRVVFDWRGRVPASVRLFSTLSAGPVIMVTTEGTRQQQGDHFDRLERLGLELETFGTRELAPVLDRLGARGILSLLVEGGPALHQALAAAHLVDRVQTIVTSRQLGSGVPAAGFMTREPPGPFTRTLQLGADRLIEFDVHGTD